MTASTKRHLTFRVDPHDLARIDQHAKAHHMSRSQYIICTATGQMPAERSEAIERIEALEDRMDLAERSIRLGI